MKKLITLLFTTILVFNISAQTVFNAYSVEETYENISSANKVYDLNIIIDVNEQVLKFVQDESDWFETIESVDTFFEHRQRIVQIWTNTSYWELRQYNRQNDWVNQILIEFPYLGQCDRRIYRKQKL